MQTNIFGEIDLHGLTIDQAAKTANVSSATIRNWIKTGYLTLSGKGLVSQESLENFMANVAGKEKLNSRANKSLKDDHNHKEVSGKINLLVVKHQGESIGIEYENSLSDSYRNKEGIYYTPSWVVKDMFRGIPTRPDSTFLDPCCGSGNFIIEAIKQGIAPENVYGFDVDENAVFITKQRIKDEFGIETDNVRVGDFLQEAHKMSRANISFDLIFTNPPWGKKIEKSAKERYSVLYGCGNCLDTTSLFLGASLSVLKEQGFLGFLVQEAFFNIAIFEDMRRRILNLQPLQFIDYGKAFKGLITDAKCFIIQNCSNIFEKRIQCQTNGEILYRTVDSFIYNPKAIINFTATQDDTEVIRVLYSIRHIRLKNHAQWGLGIVTGNNDRFCNKDPKEGYIPIYKGSDITKNELKSPTTFVSADFSSFQQVAPLALYQAKEKLIYKFISSDLCFYYDNQQKYVLNSANFLIPRNIPITTKQLSDLLNSGIINWLFKKLFSTNKVLRSDLELLPIHIEYFINHDDFSEDRYLKYLNIKRTQDGAYRTKD